MLLLRRTWQPFVRSGIPWKPQAWPPTGYTYQQQLTQDIVVLDPRVAGPLRGRTAWREWADTMDVSDVEGTFNVEDVSGSGDVAYLVWTFDASWAEDGEKMEAQGKGLSLFRREADGWRLSHSAWNANP